MRHHSQRGFSLIELGIGLGSTAVVGLLLWGALPRSQQARDQAQAVQMLAQAQAAMLGFTVQHARMPCPARDDSGREDCAGGAVLGRLPWRDLGLTRSEAVLNYGVGASTLLQASTAFVPNLPPAPVGAPASTYDPLTLSNGLDLCQGLRQMVATGAGAQMAGVPYAWALAHPGRNGHFDGANVGSFALPGSAQTVTPEYDDAVQVESPAEFSARLACPQRLAQAQVAARSAYVSYDLWRNTDVFSQFRSFAHDVRQTDVTYAAVNLSLAVMDIVNAVATGATALAITAAVGGGSGAAAADIAALVVATGVAVGAAGGAGYVLATDILAEIKAKNQKVAAASEVVRAAAEYVQGYTDAIAVDQKGLRP
jgi:type II secretory pathway pseudopilin PulG